ncbi:trypsin-like peptidase domain-containing protein [Streptosporangium sp. KLBMP 9127]|nr:trypsin-like peptidase domain-containing protein [Streptosporangium sp. KLBMP 9127]
MFTGWRLLLAVLLFLPAAALPAVPTEVAWARAGTSRHVPHTRDVPGRQVITPGGDRYGYARVRRPYTAEAPERVTGLLLAHDRFTGRNRVCGAAVLRSPGRDLVLTAAHCLFDNYGRNRRWYDGVVFVPAYNSTGLGDTPLGVWPAERLWVPRRWRTRSYSPSVLPWDVGVVRVAGRAGRRLEKVTGPGLRPLVSRSGEQLSGLTLLGYPGDVGYSGDDMFRCLADAGESGGPGPGMLMTRNCQIVGGHSGGPVVYGGAVAGVASSSSPYRRGNGFTLITRLTPHRLTRMLALAR